MRARIPDLIACLVAAILLSAAPDARAAGPDLARMSGPELTAFTRAMPMGGELHIHLGGAIFAESEIRWAVEDGAEALAAEMAAHRVLVEINPTSNDVILGVRGRQHPYAWLRARGVPTALSTDDPGILRIDLSHEYARAAEEGASYTDLKTSARNAIAFSFLAGPPLWDDPGSYRRPGRACAKGLGHEQPPAGACADLLASSDRAREQWRLEYLLKRFETSRGDRQSSATR